MPVNWYAALVLIVILGVGSVAFARYNYSLPTPAVAPQVGQQWNAAVDFDICGTVAPSLAASPQGGTNGLTTTGSGVILIAPKSSLESGNNATLGKFASEYSGLKLTNSLIKLPDKTVPEYVNGEKCATGTPDAGKKGVLRVRSWILSTATTKKNQLEETGGAYSSKPKDLKLENRQLITVGFGPASAQLPKPSGTIELALLQAINSSSTTTTTAPTTATTTTAPGSATTTTTAPASATTTTTAPAATTTTTAPAGTTTTTPAKTTTTSKSKK